MILPYTKKRQVNAFHGAMNLEQQHGWISFLKRH